MLSVKVSLQSCTALEKTLPPENTKIPQTLSDNEMKSEGFFNAALMEALVIRASRNGCGPAFFANIEKEQG